MKEIQKIYCQVENCKYNNTNNICTLNQIEIKPVGNNNKNINEADESMCASYQKEKK